MVAQILEFLIDSIAGFLVFLLLARFHFQWLRVSFRNQFGEFIIALTNWIVMPARRMIPGLAGFDLPTLLVAWVIQTATLAIIYMLKGYDLFNHAYLSPDKLSLNLQVAGRPLFVPVAIDTIGCLTTV